MSNLIMLVVITTVGCVTALLLFIGVYGLYPKKKDVKGR